MSARASHRTLSSHDGRTVHFHHRDDLKRRLVDKNGAPIARREAKLPAEHVAPVTLPVDCTGDAGFREDSAGNTEYGDCGSAMIDHSDTIWTYGQGKPGFGPQLVADDAALEAQYLKQSGGDNGLTQDDLVAPGGIWRVGVAGNPTAVIADSLDISATDVQLRRYCTDEFYVVCMGWSVPDAFLNSFKTGASFLSAMVADPNNGHWTPLSDLDPSGNTRIFTWGGWVWVSDQFLASVQPEYFVAFSALQFNAQGYNSHGRHVSEQAAKWKILGGNGPAVDAVVAMFPVTTPTPTTPPPAPVPIAPSSAPTPPAPTPTPPAPTTPPPAPTPAAPPAATAPKCDISAKGWDCPLPKGHLGACPAVRSVPPSKAVE